MLPVVSDDGMRDTELKNNVLPNEVCAFGLGDSRLWLSLYPLGEVINCDDSELSLSTDGQEWSDQLYTPLCKRPRTNDRSQWFWRLFWDMSKYLALITLLNKFS